MAIGATVHLRCAPGREDELVAQLTRLRSKIRQETGNIYYDVYRSRTEPGAFLITERYRDRDAVRAHAKADYVQGMGEQLRQLLEGEMVVQIYEGVTDD